MMATMMHVAHGDPTFSLPPHEPHHRRFRLRSHSDPEPLPPSVDELKTRIRKTHPGKYFGFSFIGLCKTAVPPVQIPAVYRCSTATKTFVGGRQVPYTREMWLRHQRRTSKCRLDAVAEEQETVATDRCK